MRFWDTSALVPLLVDQATSPTADRWIAEDPAMVVWTLAAVEITSALCRLAREGAVGPDVLDRAEQAAADLGRAAHTVVDVDAVKIRARRALRLHPLRAADALQLGAALEWVQGRPEGQVLLTFDARLATAARLEGFRALSA